MNTTLHHFAYNISPQMLDVTIKLFELLGLEVSFRFPSGKACNMKSPGKDLEIQLIEKEHDVMLTPIRRTTHIAFLSNNPEQTIEKLKEWAEKNQQQHEVGKWSDVSHWFDLTEIFLNFAIEILDSSVASD
jgi:hypothetical protein